MSPHDDTLRTEDALADQFKLQLEKWRHLPLKDLRWTVSDESLGKCRSEYIVFVLVPNILR